ncbi:MAG: MATE family efflux transporter [Prevotella sp.]
MLSKDIYAPIVKLGIPIVIGQIGTIILTFADTIMIGHHSTSELAAAAFVGQIFMLGILVAMGFAYGLTPLVGNSYGREETGRIGALVRNGLAANTMLAVLLMTVYTVLFFFIDKLGQPEELLPYMRPYYLVNLASLPFVCWFNVFKQTADGSTDTKTPMWILLSGNLVNIFGNWILIYGKLGMPELGILGAGLATLLSRILMMMAMAYVFFGSRRYKPFARAFKQSRVTWADQLLMNRMGWPLGLQMGMESGAWSLCSVIVGWIGATSLAAHQVMLAISQLFFQIYYAISASVSIRISLFHGQREYDRIMPTAWAGFHLCCMVAVLVAIPVWVFRYDIGWLFADSEEINILVAGAVLPLLIYQIPDGLQCVFSNALRGLSNVKPLMFVAFVAYFVGSIPLSYVFGIVMDGGLVGVWFACPVGLSIAAALYYYFFRRTLSRLT